MIRFREKTICNLKQTEINTQKNSNSLLTLHFILFLARRKFLFHNIILSMMFYKQLSTMKISTFVLKYNFLNYTDDFYTSQIMLDIKNLVDTK